MIRALCKVRVMLDCYEEGMKFVRQLCNFTFLGLAAIYLAAIPIF
jgi:hypothetical protein